MATSCIDVTLSLNMKDEITKWWVDQSFNGSDHNTVRFQVLQDVVQKILVRKWDDADWGAFSAALQERETFLYKPEIVNEKKIDKMVRSLYSIINESLEIACPLKEITIKKL